MLDKEAMATVSRYRQLRTEEEAIALAREEGVKEELVQKWTPGWLDHYHRTARTIVHTARQLRDKMEARKIVPFPEPPQPPGGVPRRQKSVRRIA